MAKYQLQQRERVMVTAGLVAAALIGLWWLGQKPLDAYRHSAQKVIAARQRLQDAKLWNAEVETAQKKIEIVRAELAKGANFDLWSHVDSVVKLASLASRATIKSERGADKVSAVQLELKGVSMKELVDVLYRIYNNDYVVILDRLDTLKPSQSGTGLDCRMTFISPKM